MFYVSGLQWVSSEKERFKNLHSVMLDFHCSELSRNCSLSINVMMYLSLRSSFLMVGPGNKPTSPRSPEAAQCHREPLLPASKQSRTKLHSSLIHIQEISTLSATFLPVNKCHRSHQKTALSV